MDIAAEGPVYDRAWWRESIIYQVYVHSFKDTTGNGIGDLNGVTEKLPYLDELGVDIIWLSPVYESPLTDMGYDISNYQSINPLYGGMEEWKRLLDEAGKHNIKLIMDLVVNHTSNEVSFQSPGCPRVIC
jgi:oligo-1,6-glucosidase